MASNYDKTIKATIELMSEYGYHGTSIQMIADKVGITKSTIFHHFKNKEGTLLAILEKHVPLASEELQQIVDDKNISGKEKLKKFMYHHMRQVSDNGDVVYLNLRQTQYFSKKNKKNYEDIQRAYATLVKKIIIQVQKENNTLFKNLNPKVVANGILGMCNWAVFWFQPNGSLSIDDIAEHFYHMVIGTGAGIPGKKRKKTKI